MAELHSKIINSFNQYFSLASNDTADLRARAYHARYQVYCREFQFEPEENCPNQMEQDEFDAQARHCLLVHKPTGIAVGCVRLVMPHPVEPDSPLPFERYCRHSLNPQLVDLDAIDRRRIGEFSRLAVISQFRRRVTDEKKPIAIPSSEQLAAAGRDTFPVIPVSLILAALALFLDSDLDLAFAMMEPRLARMLAWFGVNFTQIGEVVDYHGFRGPFLLRRKQVLPDLKPDMREFFDLIMAQVVGGCGPAGVEES